jgi:hypothetical protein
MYKKLPLFENYKRIDLGEIEANHGEFKLGEVNGYHVYEIPQNRPDLYRMYRRMSTYTKWHPSISRSQEYFSDHNSKGPMYVFLHPDGRKHIFRPWENSMSDSDDWLLPINKTNYELFRFLSTKGVEIPLEYRIGYDHSAIKPAELNVPGDLQLGRYVTSLPQGLKVGGDLILEGARITTLPPNLKVGGRVYLSDSSIISISPGVEIGGNLELWRTPIQSLPSDLKVGGDLNLSECRHISTLPEGLSVGGNISCYGTKITSLPPNFRVNGSLNLRFAKIAVLPPGLKVGVNLDLVRNKITSLPSDLEVGNQLNIADTPLAENHTEEEIRSMVTDGYIKGRILTTW